MKARVGDHIVLAGSRVGEPTRDGRVTEVRGADGGPPFVVEWADGRTGVIYPGPGAVLRVEHADDAPPAHDDAPGPVASPRRTDDGRPHLREWSVRITIFEGGADTSAQAVLLSDAPEHLRAVGQSHRSDDDRSVPEIGDEVAVARALRHLADRLMSAADDDIAAMTGEDVYVRRS
ncbi:dsRBD fold-containing protein [Ornithinimicrobium tianjinense]|uniref:DUF1918 domain-containing protein n=1 Tax=Ornithinimicrobium tianjinense TaxID=1195761 RepID=A0A917BIU8_9MICO|nr:dsRBD fold-containing protein [Ornithinimicrobium tianjinense]GGF43657.1 hypothetical protein GCM10011366_09310 [Ornithinimicrobium tianjinense]